MTHAESITHLRTATTVPDFDLYETAVLFHFSQPDPRWANEKTGPSESVTIARAGCFLSALSTVANHIIPLGQDGYQNPRPGLGRSAVWHAEPFWRHVAPGVDVSEYSGFITPLYLHRIGFAATASDGTACEGAVRVSVPDDMARPAVEDVDVVVDSFGTERSNTESPAGSTDGGIR